MEATLSRGPGGHWEQTWQGGASPEDRRDSPPTRVWDRQQEFSRSETGQTEVGPHPAALEIALLGLPTVRLNGQPFPLGGKSLALLCYLALEGAGCRSELARLLWSELPLALARRNLRRELHRLRSTGLAAWLWATGERVGLHAGFGLDLHRFRALRQAQDWREAAALLRGPPLGDLQVPSASRFGRWQAEVVTRLNEEQLDALAARADELVRQQRPEAAQWVYARMLRLDPLRESAHRGLLNLLHRAGDTLAAHQQYTTLAHRLAGELALAPLPETTALQVRQTQPPGTLPSEPLPPAEGRAWVSLPPLHLPFTGRGHELQTLARTRAALITGEAGVGKTRLLQEFLGQTGALWLSGPPGAGRNLRPFAALASLFRSNPDLLHELDGQARAAAERLAAGPGPESGGRPESPALLEAALWTLLGHRTLVAEDLNTLDCATLGVVGRLIQRSAAQGTGRILLSLCTPGMPAAGTPAAARERAARPELAVTPKLAAMLCHLERRGQLTRLCLDVLGPAQVAQLIARMAGQAAPVFSARLHQATAGHPLFLLETLQALRESGRLDTAAQPWQTPHDLGTEVYAELPLPTSLAGAVQERATRLGAAAERVLGAAAVWSAVSAQPFGPARLQAVCALSESETRQQLERAAQAGLLCQADGCGDAGFRFSHAVYSQTLLGTLERPRRELLERQFGTERRAVFGRSEDAHGSLRA